MGPVFLDICNSKVSYLSSFCYKMLCSWVYGYMLKRRILVYYVHCNLVSLFFIFLRYNSILSANALTDIVVVDYLNIKGSRFEINYVFWSYINEIRFIVKIYIDPFGSIPSIIRLFSSADWLEREVWDMYGIKVLSHPNLRRILTDYGFKGYPLRKDFPLAGYVEVFYDDSFRSIKVSQVESSQQPKFYKFNNPWKIII